MTKVSILEFGASTSNTDNYTQIQDAINYVYSQGGGDVHIPNGRFKYSNTLSVKDCVRIIGEGADKNASQLEYTGSGFAMKTAGSHLRQRFKDFYLTLNYNQHGIKIGDVVANLNRDLGILPRQIDLDNVVISGLGIGQVGIKTYNASHITMKKVRSAYGNGGLGLVITCDGYNSGVFVAEECSFGRHGQTQVGVEFLGGTGGLDGYVFNGCYFGGAVPIRFRNGNTSNLVFNAPHIEVTDSSVEHYAVDIESVKGLVFNGGLIGGFGSNTVVGILFRKACEGVNINSLTVNEFAGTVFKNSSGVSPKHSILYNAVSTGSTSPATQFNGNFNEAIIV